MTRCVHPKCGRDELPLAPAFPPKAKIACAHVNPAGEPCPESPSTEVYDAEAIELIVKEDKLWAPEFMGGPTGGSLQAPAEVMIAPPVTTPVGPPAFDKIEEMKADAAFGPPSPPEKPKRRKSNKKTEPDVIDVDDWEP